MEKVQFILQYHGQVTINHEYVVTLGTGQALAIDWFPNNDLIIETVNKKYFYNTNNAQALPDGRYLIKIVTTENLTDVPVKFERGDYLVADNIVINKKLRQYCTADQLDILPDELVIAHGEKVTRVLFSGTKSAEEHYIRKD